MDQVWQDAPIDVLVNNAAATFIAQSEHLSFRAADAILAPTLHGTMYCTLAAGRRWIEGKHKGVVLSILSTSTITGRAFTVPSSMAKTAVLAMTRSLAVEWGPKGIRTVAIAPGAFPTPGATGQLRPEGRGETWSHRNPLGRAGEHSELANLASFLISDQAGRSNVLAELERIGLKVDKSDPRVTRLLDEVKEREAIGYAGGAVAAGQVAEIALLLTIGAGR